MGGRYRGIWSAALRLGLVFLVAAAPPRRVTLGQYGVWGAFRETAPTRCFAVARPISGGAGEAALAISTWPRLRAHDQLHVRLSRAAAGAATLELGERRFPLVTYGIDAWALTARDDAQIVKLVRGGLLLQVRAVDARGRRFHDRYRLEGAASAIDAMRLGCLPD